MYNSGTSTVIRSHAKHQNNRQKTFLCCQAWVWLVSIVAAESVVMLAWMVREYYAFDYTCVFYRQPNGTGDMTGPRVIYAATDKQHLKKRNLRTLDVSSAMGGLPRVIQDGPDTDMPLLLQPGFTGDRVLVADAPFVIDEDPERFKRSVEEEAIPTETKPRRRKIKRRRKKVQPSEDDLDPGTLQGGRDSQEDPLTTVESYVMIEQLPLSEQGDDKSLEEDGRVKTIRAKTTKIKHLPQNPLGGLKRKLKRRKKVRPTTPADGQEPPLESSEEPEEEGVRRPPGKRYRSMEEPQPSKFRRNYFEDTNTADPAPVPRTKLRRYKGKGRRPAGQGRRPKPKPEEEGDKLPLPLAGQNNSANAVPLGNGTTTTAVPVVLPTVIAAVNTTNGSLAAGALSKAMGAAFDSKEEDKQEETTTASTAAAVESIGQEVVEEEESSSREAKAVPVRSLEDVSVVPNRPPGSDELPRQANSKEMVERFSALVLCVSRILLDVWCVAQLVAAVPFMIGICIRSRCFFFFRLLLDALFLFVLVIYTMTVIVYPCFLYAVVEGMTMELVVEWLIFGVLLFVVLIVYILLFITVFRCCDIVLNDKPKSAKEKRSKSLLYTEIGSEQLLEAADEM